MAVNGREPLTSSKAVTHTGDFKLESERVRFKPALLSLPDAARPLAKRGDIIPLGSISLGEKADVLFRSCGSTTDGTMGCG